MDAILEKLEENEERLKKVFVAIRHFDDCLTREQLKLRRQIAKEVLEDLAIRWKER